MSIQLPPYRPVRHRSGLKVMLAAIHALLMRELQTRFGGYRLGYLWAPLEVMLQVVFFVFLFGTIMHRILPNMDYSLFLISGLVPYRMFSRTVNTSIGAVQANRGLLMYRSVRHIDVIIARTLLELIIYFFSFWTLLVGVIFLKKIEMSIESLDTVLFCWVLMLFFSFGLSLIMMVIGNYIGELSKVLNIVFTILYFTSGVMYSVHIVPQPYLDYLLYNPIIHNLEAIRHAFSPSYPAYHIDLNYFIKWTLAVNFIGLMLYKAFENDFIRKR